METQTFGPSGPNPVAEEQFRKGFELAKQGGIDEAILAVEAAIAISQEDGRYHDLLGTLFAKKGLYEMALAEWKRSIECDPEHSEVFRRIEAAEKMRAQIASGGSRWTVVAIAALAVCFVLSLAAATFLFRSGRADRAAVSALQSDVAAAKEGMIDQPKYDALLKEKSTLEGQIQESSNTLLGMKQELDKLKTNTVAPAALQQEQELRNRVQSELAAARKSNEELKAQLSAVGSASGVQNLTSQIAQKDKDIETLNKNYKSLNDERKRLEEELTKTNTELLGTRGQIASLQAQAAAMVSATESTRLKGEVQSLTDQLAKSKAGQPAAAADSKEVLFLVNGTLEAVRHVAAGKPAEARTALEKIQGKAPKEAAFAETLKSLGAEPPKPEPAQPAATPKPAPSPEETKPAEAKPQPTPKPEPIKAKPTPKPSREEKAQKNTPTPKPKKAKPTPKPETETPPTPTPKPSEPHTVAEGLSAIPRAVHTKRLDSSGSTKAEPKTETKPKVDAPPEPPRADGRKKELFETKKRLTEQALSLYRQRKFDEAERLVNRAHQIDPNDPAVNQLQGAIRKARSK